MKIPMVSIVGRVNTGKSTLFNKLIKKPLAITDAKPGLTRDRIKKLVAYSDIPFYLTDTGGL
ncbi:MAG: GTPase, partial [candidate division WOR-3 bacterium]